MNQKTYLTIIKIKNVFVKQAKAGNQYVRITFLTNEDKQVKTNISLKQWKELITSIDIKYNPLTQEIESIKPFNLSFNILDKTTGETPRLLFEPKIGNYNGLDFSYYELSSIVLVNNNIITKHKLNDYSLLFPVTS